MREAIQRMPHFRENALRSLDDMIARLDANKDGRVSYQVSGGAMRCCGCGGCGCCCVCFLIVLVIFVW